MSVWPEQSDMSILLINYNASKEKAQDEAKRKEAAVRREKDIVPKLISLEEDAKVLTHIKKSRRRHIAQGAGCCSRMVQTISDPCSMPCVK